MRALHINKIDRIIKRINISVRNWLCARFRRSHHRHWDGLAVYSPHWVFSRFFLLRPNYTDTHARKTTTTQQQKKSRPYRKDARCCMLALIGIFRVRSVASAEKKRKMFTVGVAQLYFGSCYGCIWDVRTPFFSFFFNISSLYSPCVVCGYADGVNWDDFKRNGSYKMRKNTKNETKWTIKRERLRDEAPCVCVCVEQ